MVMKKLLVGMVFMVVGLCVLNPVAQAYNFGDYRSATLAGKAWQALSANDLDAVLAYTNKCVELYANNAKKMQDSLSDYPAGTNEEIFAYWALNDLATSLFMYPSAFICAKSLTRFKSLLVILGVPLERTAISRAPSSSIPILSIAADLFTMSFNSSAEYISSLFITPNLSLRGDVSNPIRVVAPISVNLGRSSLIDLALGPFPIIISNA